MILRNLIGLFGWTAAICGWCAVPSQAQKAPNGETPSLALSTPIKLTVVASGKEGMAFKFGAVRFGQIVTHTFTLRNDTAKPVALRQVQTTCGCLTIPTPNDAHASLPVLQPGLAHRITVALDTAQIPERPAPTLLGSAFSLQVWVYAKEEAVHPVAVLELTGRITQGAGFEQTTLDFGNIRADQGVSREIRLRVDRALYRKETLRLVSTDPLVKIVPPPEEPVEEAAVGISSGPQVTRTFRVSVLPHAPVGPLKGSLRVEGLATEAPAGTPKDGASPVSPATQLAFTGQVKGRVEVEPGMVVFGMVRRPQVPFARMKAKDARLRTRFALVIGPLPAQTAGPKLARHGKTPQGKTAPFWRGATVAGDGLYVSGALVPVSRAASASESHPPALPDTLSPDRACWLRVVISPAAPHKTPIAGSLRLTFQNGDRVRVPVTAECE